MINWWVITVARVLAGADAMRGERPLFSGPWFARARAHCDRNSFAWNSRTFSRPVGHSPSSLGPHHHWTHFLRIWPLGDSATCWGGVSLRDCLNPESGGAKNLGAATTTKEKSLEKPSSTRQDVDHFQTCAEAATSLYRPYACLNIGITKSMAILPLPDRNHTRRVLFTAVNSSLNTVVSEPIPRNAVAKASVSSEIWWNKIMHLIDPRHKQNHRSNDYADGIAWDGESPRNNLQSKHVLLAQL